MVRKTTHNKDFKEKIIMKKKIIAIMLVAGMALSAAACGSKTDDTADNAAPAVNAAEDAETSSDEFTLLDVTADMIKCGLYATSEDGTELVLSMFTSPSGQNMVSFLFHYADGTGDVVCGEYTANVTVSEEDPDLTYTYMNFTDVYTGTDCEVASIEAESDGSCAILTPSGDVYTATYLSAEDTINYMGVAIAIAE